MKRVLAVGALGVTTGLLWAWWLGVLPATVPVDAPVYALSDLADALRSVRPSGEVDLNELKRRHASLERFIAAMAATSPQTAPERFPSVDAQVAYWLNAAHALALHELLVTRSAQASWSDRTLQTWPIGGRWLTRRALERSVLEGFGDARLVLALFTGERGRGVLDGAPFEADTLDAQLNDAVRRFVRRADHVSLEGKVVRLSAVFLEHEEAFLAALPEGRKHVLQIVWAYLPDACDDAPGCLTRTELDLACGTRLASCELRAVAPDSTLAAR